MRFRSEAESVTEAGPPMMPWMVLIFDLLMIAVSTGP